RKEFCEAARLAAVGEVRRVVLGVIGGPELHRNARLPGRAGAEFSQFLPSQAGTQPLTHYGLAAARVAEYHKDAMPFESCFRRQAIRVTRVTFIIASPT